jgi:hypothetical protein
MNILVVDPVTNEIPRNKADLDSLTRGSFVRVTHKRPYRNWEVYEGLVDGKYSFIHQHPKNKSIITCTRVRAEDLVFEPQQSGRGYGLILECPVEALMYTPGHERYEMAKQMLEEAKDWRTK